MSNAPIGAELVSLRLSAQGNERLTSLHAMKPLQRLFQRCKRINGKAEVGGGGAPELLRINQFRSSHEGDTNGAICRVRPVLNDKEPTGDARRFKACQISKSIKSLLMRLSRAKAMAFVTISAACSTET